jgi:ABC-type multidrug transport system ATPase subunit/ABC-type multidrug transport system permease subunit
VHAVGDTRILNGISAVFPPNSLTAILGPSGSGKTTLLNILSGVVTRSSEIDSVINFNGTPMNSRIARKHSTFITQDDLLHPTLTAKEALAYACDLRLPKAATAERKARLCQDILQEFGLDGAADVVIGHPEGQKGLSGGQRKRLSIALEMVYNPSVIFLDEPTSGLDSYTAAQCISVLEGLARNGHTVVATIHQPSASLLSKFHNVLLIVDGGIAFSGPPSEIVSYFRDTLQQQCPDLHNPADFMLEVVSGRHAQSVTQLIEAFKASSHFQQYCRPAADAQYDALEYPDAAYQTTKFQQCGTLLKRSVKISFRDVLLVRARMGSHIMVGLVLGLLFQQVGFTPKSVYQRQALCLFTLIFVSMSMAITTVLTLVPEKAVILKEHHNNWYGMFPYLVAKNFSDVPMMIVPPLCFVSIVYFMSEQGNGTDGHLTSRWLALVLAALVQSMCAQAWAVFCSVIAPHVTVAIFLAPMSLVASFIFSGFFVAAADMPVYLRWITKINFTAYTWEMSMIAAFYQNECNHHTRDSCPDGLAGAPFSPGVCKDDKTLDPTGKKTTHACPDFCSSDNWDAAKHSGGTCPYNMDPHNGMSGWEGILGPDMLNIQGLQDGVVRRYFIMMVIALVIQGLLRWAALWALTLLAKHRRPCSKCCCCSRHAQVLATSATVTSPPARMSMAN